MPSIIISIFTTFQFSLLNTNICLFNTQTHTHTVISQPLKIYDEITGNKIPGRLIDITIVDARLKSMRANLLNANASSENPNDLQNFYAEDDK